MGKGIKDLPEVDRPREMLRARGPQALSDAELLAVLIRTGTKGKSAVELAQAILEEAGPQLARWGVEDFARIAGIGEAKACQILAALEFARRHSQRGPGRIERPEDALPYLAPIRDRKQEHFLSLTLNGAHEVIASRVVTVGLLTSSQVHPREVFADAIADRAAAVVLAHNHPSGNPEPSGDDLALTRQLVEAGKILGIEVLDHLIVTKTDYTSLREQGYIP